MMLLNSSAQHIFWLGRYLTRIQSLCNQFPFQDNDSALSYAHAFCLPAFDASSLNELILDETQPTSFVQQFQYARENILELRGVLSAKAYAELNQYIKNAKENAAYICDVVGECHDIIEAEAQDIFLFFKLGQCLEQIDCQLRMKHDVHHALVQMNEIVDLLISLGWTSLQDAWNLLQDEPNHLNFYHFSDGIQQLFEVDV